jgi:acylglycerol lipase
MTKKWGSKAPRRLISVTMAAIATMGLAYPGIAAPNAPVVKQLAHSKVYREGFANARKQLEAALNKAKKSDQCLAADYASRIAALDFAENRYGNARKKLDLSLELLKSDCKDAERRFADGERHLADCYLNLEDYKEAVKHYSAALAHLDKVADPSATRARVLRSLADAHFRNKDYEQTIAILLHLAKLQVERQDKAIGWTYIGLKDACEKLNQKERAQEYFELAVATFQKTLEQPQVEHPSRLNAVSGLPTAPAVSADLWTAMEADSDEAPANMWQPTNGVKPWGILLCVHGMGLHKSSFTAFGEAMAKRGLLVVALDVRGFGSWAKGVAPDVNFDLCFSDIRHVSEALKKLNPNTPLFILGESMGGAIALQSANRSAFIDAVVSAVPAPDRYNSTETNAKFVWSAITRPGGEYNITKDVVDRVSRNTKVVEDWKNDENARLKFDKDELLRFNDLMAQTKTAVENLKKPVLITQGGADPLVKPESTIKLYGSIASPNKTLLVLGWKEHLIFENAQFSEVLLEALMVWLKANVGAGGTK